MRYGIFSDVHSNLEAFEEVLEFYKREHIDNYIFLGDIVGYGANPHEVIELLRGLGAVSVAGNHDQAVIGRCSLEHFNPPAQAAITWTLKLLLDSEREYLRGFLPVCGENGFICVHGSLETSEPFEYILNVSDARRNFSLFKESLLFVGHSHKMQAYRQDGVSVQFVPESRIELVQGTRYIVNVGSVGQPRDRDARAGCCIYDSDEKVVILKRLEYAIKKAADKILGAGLPEILATRLSVGW